MLVRIATDRGVQATAAAAAVLAAGSLVRPLPWVWWVAWALVGVWAVAEAARGE